jgi:DNA-binding IclR family transcriptional regulator
VVVKNEDQLAPAGQIQWRDDHLEAFMAIDGERTVNEVIAAAAQPAAAVHQLLYTLETFDVIRFR